MASPSTLAPPPGSAAAAAQGDEARIEPRLWRIAFVLIFGAVLSMLDATVVSVGVESVAHSLHASLDTAQWFSTGYLLAVSLVMPVSGWAAERFGSKRAWMVAVAVFVVGSALCGLAWSAAALIVFRLLQGVGGALMQPIGQAFLAQEAGPARMGRMMGVISLPVALAPVLGPVAGGLIVQHLDWRWMFWINLPLGVATLLAAWRLLPQGARGQGAATRLDVRGLALLSPGIGALVYGCSRAGAGAGLGSAQLLVPVLAGVALLLGYGVHALRGRRTPLIDLRLFARRGFSVATASSFLVGASLYSSMLLVPLYYQEVRHASVLQAGLLVVPQALGSAVAMVLGPRLGRRFSPRALMLGGVALSLLGTIAFTQLASGPAGWVLALSLLLRGLGIGATMSPGMTAVFASVTREQAPRASSALNVLNRIGGSLGTAALVVVLGHGPAHQGRPVAAAYGGAFWWALGLSALCLIPAALFPGRERR